MAFTKAKISIPSVNGDIVITATAVSSGPRYTNLADPTSSFWKDGYRLSISSGGAVACAGRTVTNFIPAKSGDVLRVKGMSITTNYGGQNGKIVLYSTADTESSKLGGLYGVTGSGTNFGDQVSTNGDISTYTVALNNSGAQTATSECQYIRLDGVLLTGYTADDVAITVNEEIPTS